MCQGKVTTIALDPITKTRTLLRCYFCRTIIGYWDFETPTQQEQRIKAYHEEHPKVKWSNEEIESLYKVRPAKRDWTEKEKAQFA